VQIDAGGAVPAGATADEVIANSLLNGRTTSPSPDAIDTLAETGLDAGEALSALESDIDQTVQSLEAKVLSVTVAGEEIWRRK
jgi:hypothetical protein